MEILPDRCSAIAKKELIYAGTVGLICWLGGIVFINRKKTSDAKSVMADTAKVMLNDQVTWWYQCFLSDPYGFKSKVMVFSVCPFRGMLYLEMRISDQKDQGWINPPFFFKCLKTFVLCRFVCGCSQREPETRTETCCPSKKAPFIWQYRHKSVLLILLSWLSKHLNPFNVNGPKKRSEQRHHKCADSGHRGELATLFGMRRLRSINRWWHAQTSLLLSRNA